MLCNFLVSRLLHVESKKMTGSIKVGKYQLSVSLMSFHAFKDLCHVAMASVTIEGNEESSAFRPSHEHI